MKKKFKEVIILFVPPLFNKVNIDSKQVSFLNIGDFIDTQKVSDNMKISEKKIRNFHFSDEILKDKNFIDNLIRTISQEQKEDSTEISKAVIINFPINNYQFNLFKDKFLEFDIKITKVIISNPSSFDMLIDAKSKNFLCPFCFKSYDKAKETEKINNIDYYRCPFDGNIFTSFYADEFTEFFTEYFLKNSLEVIQNFVDIDDEKNKMSSLDIDSIENFNDNLKKKLKAIINND